jgi:hypothetical protein
MPGQNISNQKTFFDFMSYDFYISMLEHAKVNPAVENPYNPVKDWLDFYEPPDNNKNFNIISQLNVYRK